MQLLDFHQSLCNRLQVPAPSRRRTADAYRAIPQNALRQVIVFVSSSIEGRNLVQLMSNLLSVAHQPGFFDRTIDAGRLWNNHQLTRPHQSMAQVPIQHIEMISALQQASAP
jgi:hypothetical protein